jgi:hypothetical protein
MASAGWGNQYELAKTGRTGMLAKTCSSWERTQLSFATTRHSIFGRLKTNCLLKPNTLIESQSRPRNSLSHGPEAEGAGRTAPVSRRPTGLDDPPTGSEVLQESNTNKARMSIKTKERHLALTVKAATRERKSWAKREEERGDSPSPGGSALGAPGFGLRPGSYEDQS